jgi:arylsulfatase A-like enzyme
VTAEHPVAAPPSLAAQLRLAACLGLVAGYADAFSTATRRLLVEPIVFVGRHQIWTAPVADMVLFVVLGLGFALVLHVVRHPVARVVPFATYAGLGVLGALYLFPSVHRLTVLALAVGVGMVAARWSLGHEATLAHAARRAFPWLAGATLTVMLVMLAWQRLAERRALAALPPAGRTPNVLLLVLDTVRAMNLSLYGYHRPTTPELDRRAGRAVRFTQAIAPAPWTLPSHAAMLTGHHVHELTADWMVPLGTRFPTLAEVLGRAGYRSAGFVANTDYCSEEVGLGRGFSHYEDYVLTPGQIARSSALGRLLGRVQLLRRITGDYDNLGRRTAPEINARLLAWLDRRNGDGRPWFAFLNFYDAHRPYLPPAPFDTMFQTPGIPKVPRLRSGTGPEPQDPTRALGAIDAYDAAIAALDHSIGELLRQLESRGALEHTIVIVVGDHGEEFLEHGAWDHGNTLYLPAVHVPLLIFTPDGAGAGRAVGAPVSLTDLPATIMDLAGLQESPFPGGSLARHWRDSAPPAPDTVLSAVRRVPRQSPIYPVAHGTMVSLTTAGYHYIRNLGTGRSELYALRSDSMERTDLSATPARRALLRRFQGLTTNLFPQPAHMAAAP